MEAYLTADDKLHSYKALAKQNNLPVALFHKRFKTVSSSHSSRGPGGPLVLNVDGVTAEVPSNINAVLFPYQREGVKFLYSSFVKGMGAILGDEMGLGKSLQTIATINAILECEYFINEDPAVMIVAPASILHQWEKEFRTWTHGSLHVGLYYGNKAQRAQIRRQLLAGRLQVVLTSYETFRQNFDDLNSMPWILCVFDEVHRLKDRSSRIAKVANQLSCKVRFGLTGTVMQNNLEELWALIDFVQPNCVGSLLEMRQFFINPIKNGQRHDASYQDIAISREAIRKLSERIVGKVLLHRSKDIIKDQLPKKEDIIVFCPLTEIQQRIYDRVRNSQSYQLLLKMYEQCPCGSAGTYGTCCAPSVKQQESKSLLFPLLTRLAHIACHPHLLRESSSVDAIDFVKMAFAEDRDTIESLTNNDEHVKLSGKIEVRSLFIFFALKKERYFKSFLLYGNKKDIKLFYFHHLPQCLTFWSDLFGSRNTDILAWMVK